jgi:predicted metal-dependent phosphotriesterase family hydrolase
MFVHDSVLPALNAAGVDDEQIDTMTVQNPRASFTAERT